MRGKPVAGLPSPLAPWQPEQAATAPPPPWLASVAPAWRCSAVGSATGSGGMIGPEAAAGAAVAWALAADAGTPAVLPACVLPDVLLVGVPLSQPASSTATMTASPKRGLMTRAARGPSDSGS